MEKKGSTYYYLNNDKDFIQKLNYINRTASILKPITVIKKRQRFAKNV